MNNSPQYRLDNSSVARFLTFAGIADLLTLIPGGGDIISFVFWPLAIIYLWRKGLGIVNPKRIVAEGVSFVAELIPVVQELPTIFISSIIIVTISRIEDRTGLKKPTKSTLNGHIPANNEGVRLPKNEVVNKIDSPNHINTNHSKPLNFDGVRSPTNIGNN